MLFNSFYHVITIIIVIIVIIIVFPCNNRPEFKRNIKVYKVVWKKKQVEIGRKCKYNHITLAEVFNKDLAKQSFKAMDAQWYKTLKKYWQIWVKNLNSAVAVWRHIPWHVPTPAQALIDLGERYTAHAATFSVLHNTRIKKDLCFFVELNNHCYSIFPFLF